MFMDEGMDTGNMLLKAEIKIEDEDTSESLYSKLSKLGSELLIKTLDKLKKGELNPQKQNENDATYSKILTKEMGEIDWNTSAQTIHNLVRGLFPWPVAKTKLDSKTLKIFKTKVLNDLKGTPGTVKSIDPFVVYCGENTALEILELQFDNRKRMKSSDFFRGYRVDISNIKLGE